MSAGNLIQIIGTPGNSPALKYEIQLAEAASTGGSRTEERIDLCFSILDDLIPKLGVFQRIMKLLKDELHNAIFSDEYTAGGSRRKKGYAQTPTLVPYFSIAKRCMEEKDKEVSKLKKQVHVLKEQLYTCEADLEKASSAIEGFKYNIKQYETQITGLTGDLQTAVDENKYLQQVATQLQGQQDVIREKMEGRILGLKNTVMSNEITMNELRNYKSTYDKLQKKFSSSKANDLFSSGAFPTTIKGSLEHEVTVARSLENQILQMQNKQIEQYEAFLDTVTNRKEDRSKVKIQRERFRMTMDEIDKELLMLRSHQESLLSRLDQLSLLDPAHPHKAIVTPNHPSCPLVTQEQPFNKYAAMLYMSSDNGVNYYPSKEAEDCLSCGEKVTVCPHWSANELVIQLPLNSTHIKLTRPLLRSHAPPTSSIIPANKNKDTERIGTRPLQRHVSESTLDPDTDKIWMDFNTKFSVERAVPRCVSKDFLLKIMSVFYSKQLTLDETPPSDSSQLPPLPLLSSFYQFVIERYHLKHIAALVIHDLLTTLIQYHQENIYLSVFSHVLGGTLDSVVFRLQLLYADLVGVVSWSTPEQFGKWAHVVYPFLEEDELEQLSIDFTGHSSNTTNHQTVMDYMTWLLMKCRDPLLRQAESQLSDRNTIHTGSMNEAEFAEACLILCPKADTLAMRLYHQSMAELMITEHQQSSEKRISTRQLAYILGYVNLFSIYQSIDTKLSESGIADRRSFDNEQLTLSSVRGLNRQ